LQETGSGLAAGGKLLTSLLPHDASGSWRAALTALQHQLSRLASTPAPEEEEATISLPREEAEAIQESLQQAQQALADLQAREEEQRARIVQQAAVLSPRTTSAPDALSLAPEAGLGASPGPGKVHQMGERLDELAYRYYGSPRFWRVLARTNAIQHPLHLPPHLQLQLPPILPEPGAAF
jgi:delta 1-pyrroline-5-carboxylate dehydrogenase